MTIANHSSDWYYQYTTPSGGTCSSVVSAGTTTAIASSLADSTSYTFKAYSDNGCTTELATAAATSTLAAVTLTASDATANSLKLAIANHSSDWYYQYTTPSGGTCSSVVSAGTTTAIASSLADSTSYTFKAYSDNGCTTELATAAATSTLAAVTLTASDATANSLKLTIANHSGDWYYQYTTPSGGTCSSVVSAGTTTAIASSLADNTSYTFKAYSDNGCTTELATAAATSTLTSAVTLTASDATANSLKLAIANHSSDWYSGDWYYKYTTPSGGTCSSVVSAGTTTAIASSLADNTSYTFKAYSDNGCTTELATAAATSTLASTSAVTLTASDATANSLKLTIANHSSDWYYKYTTPSGGTCSSVVSAGTTTAIASSLADNTSYTFKAYSDNGCTTDWPPQQPPAPWQQ